MKTEPSLQQDLDASIEAYMRELQEKIELHDELQRQAGELRLEIALAELEIAGVVEIPCSRKEVDRQ